MAASRTDEGEPNTTPSKRSSGEQADEAARRRAIERIIVESAAWGYDMAQLGYETRPTPRIEWDSEGRPKISSLQSSKAPTRKKEFPVPAGYDPHIRARNLEEEIRRVEKSVNAPLSIHQIASFAGAGDPREADKRVLRQLKSRLARLDPNSALVD